jgi:excisionase family DNA binding protein
MNVQLATVDDVTLAIREVVREEMAALPTRPTPWLDVPGAAEHLSTSKDAIRAMVRRGELVPTRTPNNRLLFRPEQLDAWARGE